MKSITEFSPSVFASMTIRDVSKEAGVSAATVSRVFNAPDMVRPELRERVQRVAAALGYRPNVDMASLCQEAERIPLQLQMSLIPLPDGERDGACVCHP